MEKQAHHIELSSKVYKNDYKTSWRISGFNLMPFQEDHPVYGPWFMLGNTRASQWSVLVTKELHGSVKNIGFRLARAEESNIWDMVTFSFSLKFEDGRFLKCIDRKVVGKECNNYNYLIKTTEAKWKERVKESDFPAPIQRVFSDHFKSCQIRDLSGMSKNLSNGKGCPYMNGACGIKVCTGLESSCVSSVVQGSKRLEDNIRKDGPSGEKETTEADIEEADIEEGDIEEVDVEEDDIDRRTFEELRTIIDMKLEKIEMTEDLFQQETITVVCEIEYTCMTSDHIPEKDETEHEELVTDFGHLFTSGKFSDITLKCRNSNVPCHKAILYTRSLAFKQFLDKMVSSQQPLIVNVNFDLSAFKAVLLYIYTNELDAEFGKSEDNCWKLYKAAGLFGVNGLRSLCLEVF